MIYRLSASAMRLCAALLAIAVLTVPLAPTAQAQDATWLAAPGSGNIGVGTNWSTGTVPGMTYTGFFGASDTTVLSNTNFLDVGGLTLNAGASAYSLTNGDVLQFHGTGLVISGGSLSITNNFGIAFYNSSSAGSAAIVNNAGAELYFLNSSTAANATITNSGTVGFYQFATGGNAALTNNNAAAVVDFSGSAGPGIDNKISIGSIAGHGRFYLGANEVTVGGNNADTAVSGVISDCGPTGIECAAGSAAGGSLLKTGTGTLTLTDTNTYTGGTTFAGGTVSVGSDSNLGDLSGALTFNGGILQITGTSFTSTTRTINWGAAGGGFDIADAANTFTLSAYLDGTGGLIKRGDGTLLIDNYNDYSGETKIEAGTLKLSAAGGLSGYSRHTISSGATLDLNDTFQFVGSLAGAGTVTNSGAGPSVLSTGNDNTSATFSGTIRDGATGTVSVWVDGTGVTTFTGANTYTGGTAICYCSTLQIGDGGTTGSIVGDVTNGGTLIFNRSNAYTFAGVISDDFTDAGKVVKEGLGNTTLTGLHTYTGTTTVNAGTLSINGSIEFSSLTTVNAGGTLGGTGIVGNTFIDGGTLAPGNSIGTLNIVGSLALTAASTYLVEISPSSSDLTIVSTTADLGGATVNASFATGAYIARQYTILTATGGLGGTTFGSLVNTNLPSGFKTALSYDANNVYLDLSISFAMPGGLTINQQNVADALTGFFNRTGGIPAVFGTLTPAGLTQASGETATGLQQASVQAMNLFLGVITDPAVAGRSNVAPNAGPSAFADTRNDALAYAASGKRNGAEREAFGMITKAVPRSPSFETRWNVWASGFGGSQTTDGHAALGSNTTTARTYGMAVGADYLWSPQTTAGFAMAGGATSFSVAGGGTGKSDLFQAGAYLRHTTGSTYLSAAAAYGWQDVTTDRVVTVAGIDRLQAHFHANAFSGRVELGNRFVQNWLGCIGLTPYAAAQIVALDLPAYAERVQGGANNFALAYDGKTVVFPRSELGLRSDKSFAVTDAILTLRGRAAWAHDFNTDRTLQATFQSLPGASFIVNGAAQARDAALVSAAAETAWSNGLSLAATFEGEFSAVTRSYAGKGVVRYVW